MRLRLLSGFFLLSSVVSLRVDCDYKIRKTGSIPSCVTSNLQVESPNTVVDRLVGKHTHGNTNKRVKKIFITDSPDLEFMPMGIESFFENLDGISVTRSGLKKITNIELQPFPNLKYLWLDRNKLKVLESGLFRYNSRLHLVSFKRNQLATIAADLFVPIDDLEHADFIGNACIDLKGGNRFAVRVIMREINKNCQNAVDEVVEAVESDPTWLFDYKCTSATFHSSRSMRGTNSERGKFPFVVALLNASDSMFFCGGSLISDKHVLTAAHCVHKRNFESAMDPEEIVVLLGRSNLNLPTERSSEHRDVDKIMTNGVWNSYSEKHDGDLAILVLDHPVQFSKFIRPVCLENNQKHKVFDYGFSIGWGKDGNRSDHQTVLVKTQVTGVGDDKCKCLGCFHKKTMFCAKEDELNGCRGDFGRGVIVPLQNKLTLVAMYSAENEDCGDTGHAVFTIISKHLTWIKKVVAEDS